MYQYVRPDKVLAAQERLKANNPLYKEVQNNGDWLCVAADDADLWEALSAQHCPLQDESRTNSGQQDTDLQNCKWFLYLSVCVCMCVYVLSQCAY